ncbi:MULTISPECIES: peptidase domain-containing ABC transporter [Sphingobacterium]|uniref:peptidase domain-containing ABC transporter n=1 Tax=Sphingobacterium TaxID=28453 RepID=UPI0010E34E7B|nr:MULTISPECIES: ATP-binding cassette domain-containing protein [Sphingobacterium]MCW2263021.1 ABC-type bacteriocin/lantibiotic exporter with double-glycine peptidase domain [Sphingobacterium kitahiroshimense]TCR11989.1 ABC-type bacteriocin/lantibiotic exporter with double-glycine peptidase domain [Sphingobacterium sp. JUb78]
MANQEDYTASTRMWFKQITKEKKDVASIYIYAILSGLVQLSIPLGIQAIVSFVLGATMVTSLYLLIGFVVLGTFLYGVFRVKVMQIIEKIQQKIFVEYSIAFAKKLPKIDLAATKKYYLPELVNRFFDILNLQKSISKILLEIPTALIQIFFGIILLSFYHVWFLVFGAVVIIIVGCIFYFTMDSGIQSSVEESNKKYEVASWLEDIASAIKTFKINSKSDMHLTGTDERVVQYLDHRTSHFKVLLFQYKSIIGFNVTITLVMLGIGTYLLINQKLNIGAFVATEIVVIMIMSAVEKLIKSLESYYDMIASVLKLHKVTGLREESNGEIVLESTARGMEVVFKDVSLNFADSRPVFIHLNFTIPANSLTMISGQVGAGKSMLLNMIAGFYEPSGGTVLFDKIPIKNIDKIALRNRIGLYMEDMTIIKGTLHENLVLGRENISTEDILRLAESIGIEQLSDQFSNGFYTLLSETDTEISFSSRKMILILRALLGNNRLLLLEDPLDGMDEVFRKKLTQYLDEIKQHTTVILVSKEKEVMEIADQHLYLQNRTIEIK